MEELDPLVAWLKRAGLSGHYESFRQHGITLQNLSGLCMQSYAALGVTDVREKRRLFELVQTAKREGLGAQAPPAMPPSPVKASLSSPLVRQAEVPVDGATPEKAVPLRTPHPVQKPSLSRSPPSEASSPTRAQGHQKSPVGGSTRKQYPPLPLE
eukprot:Sspe_Gene.79529::Locus_49897_Transcript_1_1_Confidence_1.000_Length_530::g.79529::m.79529